MTFAYVRKRYGLDVRRGDIIEMCGVPGRLVRCTCDALASAPPTRNLLSPGENTCPQGS